MSANDLGQTLSNLIDFVVKAHNELIVQGYLDPAQRHPDIVKILERFQRDDWELKDQDKDNEGAAVTPTRR